MEHTHHREGSPGLAAPWVVPESRPQVEVAAALVAAAPAFQAAPPAYQAVPPAHPGLPPYQGPPPGYGPPGYGPPGYGPPGYGPPGFAPPGYPPQYGVPQYPALPRPRTNGLPRAALVTGLVSLVVGNAISFGVFGAIGGVVGIVLGVVGLRRARSMGLGSPRQAVAGVVVSAISVAVGVTFAAFAIPDLAAGPDADQGPADLGGSEDPVPAQQAPAEWMNPGGEWAGMPLTSLALGQRTTINEYSVTVVAIELNADAIIAKAHPRNSPAYGQFVMATLSVSNRSVQDRNPLDDLMASYPGTDNYLYDETSCGALTPRPVSEVGALGLDESAEYDVCIDVPRYAIGGERVLVHDLSTTYWEARMWSAD